MANGFLGVNTGSMVLVVHILTKPPLLQWQYVFLPSWIARDSICNAVWRRRIGLGVPVKVRRCLCTRVPFAFCRLRWKGSCYWVRLHAWPFEHFLLIGWHGYCFSIKFFPCCLLQKSIANIWTSIWMKCPRKSGKGLNRSRKEHWFNGKMKSTGKPSNLIWILREI